MPFYEKGGGEAADSKAGVRTALQAILASPYFIFRFETRAATASGRARLSASADFDLASRLSFFLWGTPPDQELLDAGRAAASSSTPRVLEKQARRMLADPRSEALGTRFAAQWLRLQDIDKVHPDPNFYPELRRATSPTRCGSETEHVLQQPRAARTAACSICSRPTTRSSTSGSRGTTAFPASPATSSARCSIRTHAPRPARPGQHAGADVARQPHVAGAARQVGDGSAARHAAAAAAAGRARRSTRRPARRTASC